MAEAALKKNKSVCSFGSIIHNRQVVKGLSRRGLKVIRNKDNIRTKTVVISSHGLSPKVTDYISEKGRTIIDTTCPFVLNAQRIARSLGESGYTCVIVGDREHPEVKALVGFLSCRVYVVKDKKEAGSIRVKPSEKVGIISQTTQSTENFLDVVKKVLGKGPRELRIFNTICRDVVERQEAARHLARTVDVMVVIGGKDSANTRRLYEVCKKISDRAYLVETENGLENRWFKNARVIGITSGASTPDWIVERVANKIKGQNRNRK